jgi:hypothetical protein
VLQELVDDGTITATQADAVATHLVEQMPDRGGRGHDGRHGGGRGVAGTVVADALGITDEELRTALASGQTIAELAAAEGVDVQVVIDAMLAEVEQRLDDKVADGRITQEDADAKLTEATERITERVNTAGLGRMGRGPAGATTPDLHFRHPLPARSFDPGAPGFPGRTIAVGTRSKGVAMEAGRTTYGTIIVGVDNSQESTDAIEWARSVAGPDDRIVLLHAWQLPVVTGYDMVVTVDPHEIEQYAKQGIDETVERLETRAWCRWSTRATRGGR